MTKLVVMLTRSTIFHWHQQSMQGRASASPKPKNGRPVVASTETMVNTIGTMLADDDSSSQRQTVLVGILQTTQTKIIFSLFFPAISVGVYAYAFMQNVRTGVLFAFSADFFTGDVTNSGLLLFFIFFDSRCSRLVMGLVSLLKTQPLYINVE